MKDSFFWDSNLWIYLFIKSRNQDDLDKKQKLQNILQQRPHLISSVQVLNEVANVLMRKYNYVEPKAKAYIEQIIFLTKLLDLTKPITLKAFDIKAQYQLGWYDSLIISAALESNSKFLFSEDLQDGMVIDKRLTIVIPFYL